ncbi:hypothetical protein ES705_47792 [subsurface metagenome]
MNPVILLCLKLLTEQTTCFFRAIVIMEGLGIFHEKRSFGETGSRISSRQSAKQHIPADLSHPIALVY